MPPYSPLCSVGIWGCSSASAAIWALTSSTISGCETIKLAMARGGLENTYHSFQLICEKIFKAFVKDAAHFNLVDGGFFPGSSGRRVVLRKLFHDVIVVDPEFVIVSDVLEDRVP